MTDSKIINKDFVKIRLKIGEKKAVKYFRQADRLLNPVANNIIEYRDSGAVTVNDNICTFHAFADMHMKEWRVAFTTDVTAQFIK